MQFNNVSHRLCLFGHVMPSSSSGKPFEMTMNFKETTSFATVDFLPSEFEINTALNLLQNKDNPNHWIAVASVSSFGGILIICFVFVVLVFRCYRQRRLVSAYSGKSSQK